MRCGAVLCCILLVRVDDDSRFGSCCMNITLTLTPYPSYPTVSPRNRLSSEGGSQVVNLDVWLRVVLYSRYGRYSRYSR